jgi:outer membrane protein TolC
MTSRPFRPGPVIGLVGLAYLATPCPVHAQSAPSLTLEQAVLEALSHNDRIAAQRDAATQADLGVRLAKNAFQPKVTPNILGSFGQTNVSSQTYRVDVSQRFVTGTEARVSAGAASAQIPGSALGASSDIRFYNADTTLTVTQPLLRGFGTAATRRTLSGAEFRREDADRYQRLTEQQVALDVATAYYRVVSQEASAEIAQQSLARARTLRDASEAKLDAGLVSQLDVLRAQQLVSGAEDQLFDARASVGDARDQLLFLLGREPGDAALALDHTLPSPDLTPVDLDEAAATALRNRVDLKSRIDGAADAARQVRFARNMLLPQVDVNLALTRRETSHALLRSFGLDGYQFATFFTIAMPVDRTAPLVDYQNAVLEETRRQRDLTTFERQLVIDVKRAVRDRDRALRTVAAADTMADISRREVDVAQLRYDRGLSNNLDVITAEGARLAADLRRLQALADAAVASLRLRATLGTLDPRTDIGRSPTALPQSVAAR